MSLRMRRSSRATLGCPRAGKSSLFCRSLSIRLPSIFAVRVVTYACGEAVLEAAYMHIIKLSLVLLRLGICLCCPWRSVWRFATGSMTSLVFFYLLLRRWRSQTARRVS